MLNNTAIRKPPPPPLSSFAHASLSPPLHRSIFSRSCASQIKLVLTLYIQKGEEEEGKEREMGVVKYSLISGGNNFSDVLTLRGIRDGGIEVGQMRESRALHRRRTFCRMKCLAYLRARIW